MQSENPRAPQDYAEWLALSPEQQEWIKFNVWSAYGGVGRCFAMMAAARLMMEDRRVQDIVVGNWFGESILSPTVSNLDFRDCPPWMVQIHEGFRVGWRKQSYEFNPNDARKFEGTWTCEDGQCDAIFQIQVADKEISVSGHQATTGKPLQVKLREFDGHRLSFEAKLAPDGPNTLHWFKPCESEPGRSRSDQDLGRCENEMLVATFWNRKLDAT